MKRLLGLFGAAALSVGCSEESTGNIVDVQVDSAIDVGVMMDPDSAVIFDPDASLDLGLIDGSQPDVSTPDVGPLAAQCNTAVGHFSDEYLTLAHHDGTAVGDISAQSWSVVGQRVADAQLHESVVFELPHRARVIGFSIQYGALPDGDEIPILAGLYRDFGYNGFDFWAADPLWEGSRCRADTEPGEWLDFTIEDGVEVGPGLVYVAHRRGPGDPAWAFDGTQPEGCEEGASCCDPWGACHSSWNFPEMTTYEVDGQAGFAWNGLSTTFSYDYMVELHVVWLDPIEPEAHPLQAVPGIELGSRSAWGDFDGDGDQDLLTQGPKLFRNEGGTLTDITEASGIAAVAVGSGVWADYDNDGCLDVFIFDEANTRGDHLLRGDCAGAFVDVTAAAGLDDTQDYNPCGGDATHAPTPAAAWLDIDADGFVDLYQANFICWSDYSFYSDTVWHNEGDGTFSEWTGRNGWRGLDDRARSSRGANPIDADLDGDIDLLVNHYTLHSNMYFNNNGDGTVTESARLAGLAGHATAQGLATYYGHSIGTAWGDLDGDGDFDVVVANLAHPRFWSFSNKTQVLINDGTGHFEDIQGDFELPEGAAGLRYQETHSVPALGDFDLNGTLDLAISAIYAGRPSDFYWGRGDGTFVLDPYAAGLTTRNGWGMAIADLDQDGDLDLASTREVFLNTGTWEGHWVQIRVVGITSNRAGIGASVRVHIGDRVILRHVGGGTGQGCQDSLDTHFGLGDAETIDLIEVRFPGGEWLAWPGPHAPDTLLWLFEDGELHRGWVAPLP